MLTAEQVKERVNYIGGSDAAAILGMSRYKTPMQVWAEKTGLVQPEDISGNLPVRLGNKLEQTVAELFTEETGKKVQRVNETIIHPKYTFVGANIDRRVVGEKSILEAKTTSSWKREEWDDDEIPAEYIIQAMHYLEVTGAERCYIAALIGNTDFKIKTVERNEKAQSELVSRLTDFWNKFVVPKLVPQVTARDKGTLEALYPQAVEGKEIDLPSEALALIESHDSLTQDKKFIESRIEKTRNELRLMLGDAEIGRTGAADVIWANLTVNRLDVDALKKERPEVYAAFRKMNTARRFLIRPAKEIKHG